MGVVGEGFFFAHVIPQALPHPVADAFHHPAQRLTVGVGEAIAVFDLVEPVCAAAVGAAAVGTGVADSGIGGAGQQCGFAPSGMPGDGDMLHVHVVQGFQCVDDSVVAPCPGGNGGEVQLGPETVDTVLSVGIRIVGGQLVPVELDHNEAPAVGLGDDLIVAAHGIGQVPGQQNRTPSVQRRAVYIEAEGEGLFLCPAVDPVTGGIALPPQVRGFHPEHLRFRRHPVKFQPDGIFQNFLPSGFPFLHGLYSVSVPHDKRIRQHPKSFVFTHSVFLPYADVVVHDFTIPRFRRIVKNYSAWDSSRAMTFPNRGVSRTKSNSFHAIRFSRILQALPV